MARDRSSRNETQKSADPSEAENAADPVLEREERLARVRVDDDPDLGGSRHVSRDRRREAVRLAVEERLTDLVVGLVVPVQDDPIPRRTAPLISSSLVIYGGGKCATRRTGS